MPTNNSYIKGLLKWVNVDKPNPWGDYRLTIYPDPQGLETVREMQAKGLKNALKKDEDGWFVAFKRPSQKEMRGQQVVFPPPEVLDSDGNPLKSLIGNGSKGTVKLHVYAHNTPSGGKAIAARLEAVKIDELVPFNNAQRDEQAVANDEPLF